jgi:hypothetical protein
MSEQVTEVVAPATTSSEPTSGRAALLAELEAASKAPEPEAAKAAEPEPQPAVEAKVVPPADDVEADDVEPFTEPAADPGLAKRLEAVQKAERRAKESLAKERAELDEQRKSLSPRLEAAERFENLAKRAKYDPAGVLMALGLTDEDLGTAARHVFAASKDGAADPRHKEAAQKALREREYEDKLTQTQHKLEQLEASIQQQKQTEHLQRQVNSYLDSVTKAASDETPLVRTMLEKNPERTRNLISTLTQQLIEETGEVPDPLDVAKTLEKSRRQELIELGLDPDAVFKTAPKKSTPSADETRPANKTLSNDLSKTVSPRVAPKDKKEERAELLRKLESGQLD